MRYILFIFALFTTQFASAQTETVELTTFDKVIISPKIKATFVPSETSKVVVTKDDVPTDDLIIAVRNNTLKIYIEDHQFLPKWERPTNYSDDINYKGYVVEVTVYYTQLHKVVIRGDNETVFKGQLVTDKLKIKKFGGDNIRIDDLQADKLKVALYGDIRFTVCDGRVEEQRYRSFGDNTIDVDRLQSNTARFRSYGDSDTDVQADEKIKLIAFGDQRVRYSGTAKLRKSLIIGNCSIWEKGSLSFHSDRVQ